VRSNLVVMPPPVRDLDFASVRFLSHPRLRHSFRNLTLNGSTSPHCDGLPRSINEVLLFALTSHISTAIKMNFAQLFECRCFGAPCWMPGRPLTSMTRPPRWPSAKSIASHSLVCPSITARNYSCGPRARLRIGTCKPGPRSLRPPGQVAVSSPLRFRVGLWVPGARLSSESARPDPRPFRDLGDRGKRGSGDGLSANTDSTARASPSRPGRRSPQWPPEFFAGAAVDSRRQHNLTIPGPPDLYGFIPRISRASWSNDASPPVAKFW
jgi:hypothetical protein